MTQPLLEVRNLTKRFPLGAGMLRHRHGFVTAVDDVSFDLYPGETLGLVGESGCGKTTTGRMLVRLVEPSAGQVRMHVAGTSADVVALKGEPLRKFRRNIQMIFQDPYSSLSPRMRVREIIGEPLRALSGMRSAEIDARVDVLARSVGLSPDHLDRFPNAFSGGQRQRICIARALALNPALVVCDEPVSALDVSVRAQIVNLLKDLQAERGLSYLFIAHDLSIVENISDRVAVMYAGRIVELASTEAIFARPRHPYTATLLAAVPRPDPELRKVDDLRDPADLTPAEGGCRFRSRCPYAQERCATEVPALRSVHEGHLAACHFAETIDLTVNGATVGT